MERSFSKEEARVKVRGPAAQAVVFRVRIGKAERSLAPSKIKRSRWQILEGRTVRLEDLPD